MPHPLPPHTPKIVALLTALKEDRKSLLKIGMAMTGGKNSPMFPLDLLAFGATKRCLSLTSAMQLLVESRNMVCSRALLRLQIDTALRFSAAWLVDKPHDFAARILAGERIDRLKDRDGKRLRDAYLIEVRSVDYPWLPAVYGKRQLSTV